MAYVYPGEVVDVPCSHEWRLWEEGPRMLVATVAEIEEARVSYEALRESRRVLYGTAEGLSLFRAPDRLPHGRKRRWYCVRCRVFEVTEHPEEVW